MKLGWDGTPLLGQRSGVGNYTGRLLAALMKCYPEWDYLLYSNRPFGRLESPLSTARPVPGYFETSRWLWMQLRLPPIIHATQPALLHFTNALAPVWQPKPFVLTIHDASLFLYRKLHPPARHLTMRLILPLLARRAAAIITVSHHASRDLQRALNIPADKFHIIHEAAPQEFGRVQDRARLRALQRQYNLPEKFILFVGTLEPRKNLHRLVRSFACVKKAGQPHDLVIVGPSGWLMNGFGDEITRLGLQDSVHFTGYVPTEDLPGLFSLATLFAFPSLYEGFGLPPLEAMACGTPVLTSNRSSMMEICNGAAHLVNPEDEESLTDGMLTLLADEARRQELSYRGVQRAGQFSWERAARETAAVYEQVLSSAL